MKGSPLDAWPLGAAGDGVSESAHPTDWPGTARYEVRARIGAGGMGAVYEAFDRDQGQLVAIKTLLRFSPAALYRFKQEFRTLADVVHPNLVHLYELVATDPDHVFFAMELVRGVDFLSYGLDPDLAAGARRLRAASPTFRVPESALDPDRTGPVDAPLPPRPQPTVRSPADYARLRPALRQLVAGVSALHAAGKLHRDIKPSNVLVTPEGRVVLLDFGVATDVPRPQGSAEDREVVGTARYMAPEQAGGETPSPASDWYSVGAMLYEALVGTPAFTGSSFEVLARKALVEAPAPSESVLDVPADLDTLCGALLRRDPANRPTGDEITRWLGEKQPSSRPPPLMNTRGRPGSIEAPLVGRRQEQLALLDAFEAARAGSRLVAVRVHGASGMGKSALVQHFVERLLLRGEAAILQGRAYERESMPYKALDSIVDALSRHLMRIGERRPPAVLPPDVGALAHLFPALARIQRVNEAPAVAGIGPTAIRRRAVMALRDLLRQLAADRPLVVTIDDLQWGDVDSAGLLLELAALPFEAPVLLVMAHRDEDSSPFILETRARWPIRTAEVREVALGALGLGEARALARRFLAGDGAAREEDAAAEETADAIARESGGNPLLVEELARSFARPRRIAWALAPIPRPGAVRLEAVVQARMATLPASSLRLLELVAVSARPLPVAIVGDAAGVYEHLDHAIASLRSRRFVRTGFRDGREVVEMLHDRVRQTIVAQLSEETLREHHGRLARVLEPLPGVDTEALAVHLLGAGEKARAANYAERAAEQASAKLAFGQAVRLYKLEIEILGEASSELLRVRVRLAQVLERAARGLEAAHVYLAAAEGAHGYDRMELERGAATQLLLTGHLAEGEAALGRILAAARMRQARSILGAVFYLVVYRAALAVLGTRLRERESRDVRRVDDLRIEALHAVIIGLSFVNVVYATCNQPRHLFFALRAGDRFQVLRAAAFEALHAAARGGRVGSRERRYGEIAARMAERIGDADARAFHEGTRGIRLFLHGRWREACEVLVEAIDRYAATPAGWHSNAQLFVIYSLMVRGHLAEVRLHHAARLADAGERGDLYTAVNLRIGHSNSVWLMTDDVALARRHVREAMAAWPDRGFSVQRYRALVAEVNIDLYAGDGAAAYARLKAAWPALRWSLHMGVQCMRGDAYFMFARCALATGRPLEALRFAHKLEREKMTWTSALAALVRALVAGSGGAQAQAIAGLEEAAARAEADDMKLHAAVARMRIGALRQRDNGDDGDDAAGRARAWMIEQGVVRPDRIAAMLAPGME